MPNTHTRVRGTYVRGTSWETPAQEASKKSALEAKRPQQYKPRTKIAQERARERENQFHPLGFGERMLRNTAVCIALLLCVLAVQGLDYPIAQTVSAELHNWVTMDLDENLGSLKFVQNLLPDAALVFWHIGESNTYAHPVFGTSLSHAWAETEPWLVYSPDQQTDVTASAAGEVMSISYHEDQTVTIRIRHSDGLETVYGNLLRCDVQEGDWVEASAVLGASDAVYFEIRSEGRSINPAPLMVARP